MCDITVRYQDDLALLHPTGPMAKRILIDALVPNRINEVWWGDSLPVANQQLAQLTMHLEAQGLTVQLHQSQSR